MTLNEFLDEWNSESPLVLVHTSGSTGAPQPLWVEKERMKASAMMTCRFLGLKQGDTALLCMPLQFIAGKMMAVRALVGGLELETIAPCGHPMAVAQHIPTFAAMVPLQVYNSLQVEEERERLQQIRQLIIGGGIVSDEVERQLSTFPHAVWSTYGMTETLSHIAMRRLNGKEASEWYCPLPSVNVSINEEGCLVIDAPLVCSQPLTTNDMAVMAPDGRHFRIIGRKDNIICSGGIKIQIEEVERLLQPHLNTPYIITRTRDDKYGEVVTMLIEAPLTSELNHRLNSIFEEVLPLYARPRRILSINHLLLTATGKPARAEAEQGANSHRKDGDS